MSSKIAAISAAFSAFIPWLIFAPRRLSRSFQENNPINSIMDLQICAAQSANAIQGASAASKYSNLNDINLNVSADENIRNLTNVTIKAEKQASWFSKIAKFTRNNINKVIGLGQFIKVLFSKNKERDSIIEGGSFCGMIACENLANNLLGRPKTSFEHGKFIMTPREAKYKNISWLNKLFTTSNKFVTNLMNKNKILSKYSKYVPGFVKGLIFAGASIGGFSGGRKISTYVADKVTPLGQAA